MSFGFKHVKIATSMMVLLCGRRTWICLVPDTPTYRDGVGRDFGDSDQVILGYATTTRRRLLSSSSDIVASGLGIRFPVALAVTDQPRLQHLKILLNFNRLARKNYPRYSLVYCRILGDYDRFSDIVPWTF